MTVKDIKNLIPAAVDCFKLRIPQATVWIDAVPIKVATRNTAEKLFNDAMTELDARPKPFDPHVTAEVFTGHNGYAIIIYQYRIKTENQLKRVVWHELAHICSHFFNKALEDEAYRHTVLEMDTPLRSGYAIWAEFIAEAIANYVENKLPNHRAVSWALQDRLTEMARIGFFGGRPYPYALGQYYAYLLTDSTVATMLEFYAQQGENPSIGLDNLPVPIQNAACTLSRELDEYLTNKGYFGAEDFYSNQCDEFWLIDREQMDKFGVLLDELYTICCQLL